MYWFLVYLSAAGGTVEKKRYTIAEDLSLAVMREKGKILSYS